ncbi:hypothetical protein LSH36_12g34016 [Paralvinella palmiformis]|uniref:Uncharacterized protein n=1 Tax=Paralvinella palmiformis TaxID=53620 RepID=A0AAD9NGA5_9ANNE|nr:hypothetical protein LSH36_12g34016 [Paralvinella palmiformis]
MDQRLANTLLLVLAFLVWIRTSIGCVLGTSFLLCILLLYRKINKHRSDVTSPAILTTLTDTVPIIMYHCPTRSDPTAANLNLGVGNRDRTQYPDDQSENACQDTTTDQLIISSVILSMTVEIG